MDTHVRHMARAYIATFAQNYVIYLGNAIKKIII